jgi:diacylglycerol O-acyltransferase
VTARVDLGRLGRISRHTGTQLHDVVLALSAGTLRRVAIASGAAPEDLRALVPLDAGEDVLFGHGACTVVELPVAERNAAARLAAVHAAMTAARRPQRAPGEAVPTVLAGPPEELAARLAMSSRVANLTIASVRGPERGHFVGGARVRALFPVMPMPDDHALALSTTTYDRHLHVAAIADPRALGGLARLPIMLADAVEELALSTGARGLSYAPLPRRPGRPAQRRRPPSRSS